MAKLSSRALTAVALLALGGLLCVLAWLQLRWTGELTRAARANLAAALEERGRRVAEDFEREVARALPVFLGGGHE